MFRPEKVNIAGITYKIEYVKPFGIETGSMPYGQIDYDNQAIKILDNGHDDTVLASLIHECLHAMSYHYNLTMLQDEKNHSEMDVLAHALGDALVRNDWVKF